MNIVWHYAPWAHLPAIVESGVLRGSNAGADGEHPMLWFSANQHCEPTAIKMVNKQGQLVQLTFEQQVEIFGFIRFGLPANDCRLLNWKDSCAAAGTPRETQRKLEKVGKRRGGNPFHWFAVSSEIRLGDLLFQIWIDGKWHPASGEIKEYADAWRNRNAAA